MVSPNCKHPEATASTLGEGRVPPELKSMIAEVASTAAGSRYCQAHGGAIMNRTGIEAQKATALWEYETSPLFDDAERAALARNAALVPNGVTAEHFAALRDHLVPGKHGGDSASGSG